MAKKITGKPNRYPVRLPDDAKKKLAVLAAESGKRIEDFGGEVLADALEKMYAEYARKLAREHK